MADGKWIPDLNAETPLPEAALRTLEIRSHVVREHLTGILTTDEPDIEAVHQLRVSTRRADAALRIFRVCLPGKVYRGARKRLRSLRRAAGDARDWDVFGEELDTRLEKSRAKETEGLEYLHGYALGRRDAAQPQLSEAVQAFAEQAEKWQNAILEAVRQPEDQPEVSTLLDLARLTLPALQENLATVLQQDLNDYANLHQGRIQGKRLRYAMEVFAGCFEDSFRGSLYPRIEEMQEILGRANDSHVACQRLGPLRQRLRRDTPRLWSRVKAGLDGLHRFHQRRLPQERQKFLRWWEEWQATGSPALLGSLEQPVREPE